jgi:hypothetical protein
VSLNQISPSINFASTCLGGKYNKFLIFGVLIKTNIWKIGVCNRLEMYIKFLSILVGTNLLFGIFVTISDS